MPPILWEYEARFDVGDEGRGIVFRLTGDSCVCGVDGMHPSEKRAFFFDQDKDEVVHFVSGRCFLFLTEGIIVK